MVWNKDELICLTNKNKHNPAFHLTFRWFETFFRATKLTRSNEQRLSCQDLFSFLQLTRSPKNQRLSETSEPSNFFVWIIFGTFRKKKFLAETVISKKPNKRPDSDFLLCFDSLSFLNPDITFRRCLLLTGWSYPTKAVNWLIPFCRSCMKPWSS